MSDEGIVDIIVSGLLTDGGHHKQWYLEEILRKLVGKDIFNDIKARLKYNDYEWEEAIPP